ncbi:MFS transporter [Arthrobacter sp. UC242_113]|uniref:MFS transporter n=1 Tax=Arthrobacter sp. UC242_113 TaxID=3374550 RepID=UPI003756E46D
MATAGNQQQASTEDAVPRGISTSPASTLGVVLPAVPEEVTITQAGEEPCVRPKVSSRYIWVLLLASFGAFVAFVTPIALSLAIRVKELAPDNEGFLGVVIGAGATVSLISGPITGVLSDRTRSRFGRRRPWIAAGTVVGVVGLFVLAIAPDLAVLTLGWIIAALGFNTVLANLTNSQADSLPESQRGRVGGLIGFVTMAAPIFGAVLGGFLSAQPILLFMIPGAFAVVLVALFVLLVREPDTRALTFDEKLNARLLLTKFIYNPRKYPDFSWNWLGRFLFYFGLTLNTTFTAFFFASRLGTDVTHIGGIIAISGLLSAVAVMLGAIGSGFISDKLRRRKPFVLSAGALFSLGAVIMAFSPGIELILAGTFIASIGLGVFSAVDQALLLDVIPERNTDAGRFVAINQFATSIPQAIAPIVAPACLAIGVAPTDPRNYTLLYIVAAVFTVMGGMAVLRVKSVR